MSDISPEKQDMHRAATVPAASALMRELWPSGSVKERIRSAARELGWPFSRAENLWRGESRLIRGEETVRLIEIRRKREAQEQARLAARAREIEEIANDRDELAVRLARMEAMLAVLVSSVASAPVSGEGHALRGTGGFVGAGDGDVRGPADSAGVSRADDRLDGGA